MAKRDRFGSYDEWIEAVQRAAVTGTDYTAAEVRRVLGEGWQNSFERGDSVAEAAEALGGFIRAGRREPKERGHSLTLAWFLRQIGVTKRHLTRLDGQTMLLWAHSACDGRVVMKAEITRGSDGTFRYQAVDTISPDGHAFAYGDFLLEGKRAVLLREPGGVRSGGSECRSLALFSSVIRKINESPLVEDGRPVSAYWCSQPAE